MHLPSCPVQGGIVPVKTGLTPGPLVKWPSNLVNTLTPCWASLPTHASPRRLFLPLFLHARGLCRTAASASGAAVGPQTRARSSSRVKAKMGARATCTHRDHHMPARVVPQCSDQRFARACEPYLSCTHGSPAPAHASSSIFQYNIQNGKDFTVCACAFACSDSAAFFPDADQVLDLFFSAHFSATSLGLFINFITLACAHV